MRDMYWQCEISTNILGTTESQTEQHKVLSSVCSSDCSMSCRIFWSKTLLILMFHSFITVIYVPISDNKTYKSSQSWTTSLTRQQRKILNQCGVPYMTTSLISEMLTLKPDALVATITFFLPFLVYSYCWVRPLSVMVAWYCLTAPLVTSLQLLTKWE